MLTTYSLKMPHAVYGGENAMDNITAILKNGGVRRVAMFTDKGIEGAGLFALPEEAVKASGADYYVLDDLPAEPDYMAVQKLVDAFKASGADMIVACGGGSVMDAAKLASVLVTDEYGVKELLDDPDRAKKCVPIILIPTTAGTGAPVMRFNAEHPAVKERLALAYDRCCHAAKTCTTVDEKTAWMIAKLEAIVKHLDIPTSLKSFGVPESDLEGLVEAGMQVKRLLNNNMRPVTPDDARKLYREIM